VLGWQNGEVVPPGKADSHGTEKEAKTEYGWMAALQLAGRNGHEKVVKSR
jgi:hypothetical protein